MKVKTPKIFRMIVVLMLAVALLPVATSAAEDEAGNNLSYPVLYTSTVVGTPEPYWDPANYPDSGVFYLQGGTNSWSAQGLPYAGEGVAIDWGDNMASAWPDGSKIRIEAALYASSGEMGGWEMVSLGGSNRLEVWAATGVAITTTAPTVATSATIEIVALDGSCTVFPAGTPLSAEINASGKYIYGTQWDAAADYCDTGQFVVTVSFPELGTAYPITMEITDGRLPGAGNPGTGDPGGGGGNPDNPGGGNGVKPETPGKPGGGKKN